MFYFFAMIFRCFISVTHDSLKDLKDVPTEASTHIYSCCRVPLDCMIWTSQFEEVANRCQRNDFVYITGAKGCGKTCTLCVLFVLHWKQYSNCLFVAATSEGFIDYWKLLILKHCTDNAHRIVLETKLQQIFYKFLIEMVMLNQFVIFVDLSQERNTDTSKLLDFLSIALPQHGTRVVMSASSGITITDNRKLSEIIHNYGFVSVELAKGFSYVEASDYLKTKSIPLSLDEIVHVTGTNPLLLSLLPTSDPKYSNANLKHEYKGILQYKMRGILLTHFQNLDNTISTLLDFFL